MTDHKEIRRWAEERDAHPACVRGTGRKGDTGMIRLDFPGYSGARKLQEISWDDWFRSFDENDLALVVQDRTTRGQQSNFNKLVGRETARARAQGDSNVSRRRSRTVRKGSTRKKGASGAGAGRSSRSGPARKSTKSSKGRSSGRSGGSTRSKSSGATRSGAGTASRSGTRSRTGVTRSGARPRG